MNKRQLIQTIVLGLLTAFFAWRTYSVGTWFHIALLALYLLLLSLALFNKLSGNQRANFINLGVSILFFRFGFWTIIAGRGGRRLEECQLVAHDTFCGFFDGSLII